MGGCKTSVLEKIFYTLLLASHGAFCTASRALPLPWFSGDGIPSRTKTLLSVITVLDAVVFHLCILCFSGFGGREKEQQSPILGLCTE